MSFVEVTSKNELGLGMMKAVTAKNTNILLLRLDDGFFAIGNICKHRGCQLSEGVLSEGVVECPCHGSRYNAKTGAIVKGPTKQPEPSYEVKVENDQILVKL